MATERHDLGKVIAEHHELIRRGPMVAYVLPPDRDEWEFVGEVRRPRSAVPAPRPENGRLPERLPDLAPVFRRPFDWRRDLDQRHDF